MIYYVGAGFSRRDRLKPVSTFLEEDRMRRSVGRLFLLAIFVLSASAAIAAELKVGDMAPDFTLKASDGQTYTLSKLRGKTVVLAWFPKAFTGG